MIYLKLFFTFFRIGLFTIGGGYAMIPLIESEVVNKNRWLDKNEFADLLAVAQSVPGVFAVNMAVYIGYKIRRLSGGVVTAVGTILPSFLIILGIAVFFQRFKEVTWVNNVFKGIRPAVVALIAIPVFNLARNARIGWHNCWIPILAALLIWLLGVSPVWVIAIAALLGAMKRGEKN